MKKYAIVLTAVLLLTGCSDSSKNKSENDNTVPVSEAVAITPEKAAETINSLPNIRADDDFNLMLPENIDHISTFAYGYGKRQSNKEFYDNYMELFEYLFPDKKMDNDILRCYSPNLDYEKVNDHYNSIINETEHIHHFSYDEAAEYGADHTKNYVFALFANPICGNLSNFNKGKIANITAIDMPLQICLPSMYFEHYSTHYPDSDAVYHLADKDISVKDAVGFYEDYINNLPFPEEKTEGMRMCVVSVDVYKVADNMYGFNYVGSKEYEGIPFDYTTGGGSSGDFEYDQDMSFGFMIESDDVDQTYNILLRGTVNDKKEYSRMVSFEDAAKLIGGKLSQIVEFRLEKAELVYCSKSTDLSNTEMDKIRQDTEAAWKFTLYNPNDNLTYVCYADAVDGENFRYYTSRNSNTQNDENSAQNDE